jgi:hypothetical protein
MKQQRSGCALLKSIPQRHIEAMIAIARRGLPDHELVAAVRGDVWRRNPGLSDSSMAVYISQTRLLASVRHYLDELIGAAEMASAVNAVPEHRTFGPHLLRLSRAKKLALGSGGI